MHLRLFDNRSGKLSLGGTKGNSQPYKQMKGNVRLSKIDIGAKDKREIFSLS
jgi:hypothetical protein